jgi:cytoskeleton protein RodZ
MESFGEKLRTTRENLGYSIEQVARDTHISKRYLIALEDEDFSIFPGETYLKGFLQNYSDYLGLNSDDMTVIYRNMKIQEQPIPMDQLLDYKSLRNRRPLILGIIAGVILVAGLVFLLVYFNPFGNAGSGNEDKSTDEIEFKGEKISVDLTRGMSIVVTISRQKQALTAQKVEENGLTFNGKNGSESMIVGEEKYFDMDGDGTPDVAVFLTEIFKEQNQNKARVTLQQPAAGDQADIGANASDIELIERGIAKVLIERSSPESFNIGITVIKNCYIISYIDKNAREEKMSYKGDTLSFTVERNADLRFSDGGAVKLTVTGKEIDSSSANQLFATQVRWVKTTGDKYQLVAFSVK